MIVLDPAAPAARPERFSTRIVHDEPNLRVIAFHLEAGQAVPPHSSPSTVMVQVVRGCGEFTGAGGAETLEAGGVAVYAPGESHAIRATQGPLHFLATIAPRPA
jgi:quercetin dioxygenase-like cupin family protein